MGELESAWKKYKTILPEDAGPVQVKETETAFYAGATAVFSIQATAAESNSMETAAKKIQNLYAEIETFTNQLAQRTKRH